MHIPLKISVNTHTPSSGQGICVFPKIFSEYTSIPWFCNIHINTDSLLPVEFVLWESWFFINPEIAVEIIMKRRVHDVTLHTRHLHPSEDREKLHKISVLKSGSHFIPSILFTLLIHSHFPKCFFYNESL